MTFRLPVQKEWVGKAVEFYVVLFGEGLDEARAELHLVAPHRGSIERRLQVRPIQALKNGPSNY
jgi:hypothetical protein